MERYDPEENKWEVIGSMAVPRYYFGCCELQGVCLQLISHIAEMFIREHENYNCKFSRSLL